MMMQVVSSVVFTGAAATAGATVWSSVAPQWRRIIRLAAGIPDETYAPLTQLVQAERRIAVRRWATPMRTMPAWREAA